LQTQMKVYIEDILGLQSLQQEGMDKVAGLMDLVINLRNQARTNKDYATSDTIRNGLQALGFLVKDDKSGQTSWTLQ
jgi:cysteinyl-tRNA synthetase